MLQHLINKFKTNYSLPHYVSYCASFTFFGMILTCIGPLIPYLSEITGLRQEQYSVLILCRSLGMMTGGFIVKFAQKHFTLHHLLLISSISLLIFLAPMSFIFNLYFQCFLMYWICAFSSIIQILANVCILKVQHGRQTQFWILLCHGMFGIGGLASPIIIYFFQINTFWIIGVLFFIVAPFYWYLKTPQEMQENESTDRFVSRNLKNLSQNNQIKNQQTEFNSQKSIGSKIIKYTTLSQHCQHILCVLFFIEIGIEVSFTTWIPSYAIIQHVALTDQQQLKYPWNYYMCMLIFRFLTSVIPLKTIKKILFYQLGLLISVTLSVLLIFQQNYSFLCMFSSISYGICLSCMFPLLLSFPASYNIQISARQNANNMIASSLGQGIFSMLIGLLMQYISTNMLFYTLLIFSVIFYLLTLYIKYQIQHIKQNQSKQNEQNTNENNQSLKNNQNNQNDYYQQLKQIKPLQRKLIIADNKN